MTPELAAVTAKRPICQIDDEWSTSTQALRRARLLELPGWAFYVAGRGGVLGADVHAETVAAALGFIAPEAVRAGWDAAGKVGPATVAAARMAECVRWGAERLATTPDLDRLVDLLEQVVDAVDPTGLPLFAATKAMPVPDGGFGGRAAVLIRLLREQQIGALIIAVRACGLTAVEAIIAGPDGEAEAVAFGWHPPFPTRARLMRRYAYAEAISDRMIGHAYATLPSAQRDDLVRLLTAAADHTRKSAPDS